MPPQHERHMLEVSIFEIGKQKMRESTRRFRFNQLLSRYNQYRELWGRKIREREEGPLDFRRRAAALSEPEPPRSRSRAAAAVTSPKADPYVKLAAGSNGEEMKRLYAEIEREHHRLGKLPTITYDQLPPMVEKQRELVLSKTHVHVAGFRVEVRHVKMELKAETLPEI